MNAVNGRQCAKTEKEDVKAEIEYWKNVVLYGLIGVFIVRAWN